MSKDEKTPELDIKGTPNPEMQRDEASGACWYDGEQYPEGTEGTEKQTGQLHVCKNGRWVPVEGG